ncbi:hypothetical protein N9P17_01050 [Tateyamaria sp.]|nr:hypothetical protein [Tateyamaria sp.]
MHDLFKHSALGALDELERGGIAVNPTRPRRGFGYKMRNQTALFVLT